MSGSKYDPYAAASCICGCFDACQEILRPVLRPSTYPAPSNSAQSRRTALLVMPNIFAKSRVEWEGYRKRYSRRIPCIVSSLHGPDVRGSSAKTSVSSLFLELTLCFFVIWQHLLLRLDFKRIKVVLPSG